MTVAKYNREANLMRVQYQFMKSKWNYPKLNDALIMYRCCFPKVQNRISLYVIIARIKIDKIP